MARPVVAALRTTPETVLEDYARLLDLAGYQQHLDRQAELALKTKKQVETAATAGGGAPIAVLCSPQVRLWTRRIVEPVLPQTPVLALNEIVRGIDVQAHGVVSLELQRANIPSPVHA